jgi:D-alanyl-D-alanine carboxypeptidase
LPSVRILKWAFALVLCAGSLRAEAAGPSLLFDPATGEVLSQDRAGEPWYPASLTKLMTAYIVFQKLKAGTIKLDQKISVSEIASVQPPSKIGIRTGGTVTVDFALQALLVHSANDMAYVLAEAVAPSIAAFSHEMNVQALKLGMSGSHFVNPNGLHDPRHISTARDIAILAATLLREFPEYSHYFSQDSVAVGKRRLSNRNSLIRQMPDADGMKTGFVCTSGFNLVATATRDGRRLGAVVLGANSGKHRADLAEMLLVDGFTRAAVPRPALQTIENMKTGTIVPADMTKTVCRQKPVAVSLAKELGGWGISFGSYETSANADMALRGRLLSPSGIGLPGQTGIMRLPGKGGYAAIVWNLDREKSLSACAGYRRENAPCEVLTPDTFAQIAALTPEAPTKRVTATAQGSDATKIKKKSSRKTRQKNKKH